MSEDYKKVFENLKDFKIFTHEPIVINGWDANGSYIVEKIEVVYDSDSITVENLDIKFENIIQEEKDED